MIQYKVSNKGRKMKIPEFDSLTETAGANPEKKKQKMLSRR